MTVGDDETIAGSLPTLTASGELAATGLVAARYQILRWLGAGGMGRVYEVLDVELGEHVALKVLHSGLSADSLERFRREVKLTRRIQHRNIARMFDIGDHGEEKFLTMELIDGESLAAIVRREPLGWGQLQPIAAQICAGLAAAHAAGVVHRDLKPDNLLLERATGRLVITDFGVARGGDDPTVTVAGAMIGTPRYMAPEQLNGLDTDPRSDLFSLGLILYELASGTRPWAGDHAIAIAVAQATVPPRPLRAAVPASFAALIARCLALDPADRIQSAAELEAAIVANLEPAPAQRPRNTIPPPVAPPDEDTTLAVLPIASAPGDEYLAEGLLDDLIDTLSATATLRVRPAGTVRGMVDPDPRAVGRQLGVDHVVVATVRRTPAGLRVAARLIGVADGFQIWAHRADCSEAEILQISELIGRGIAAALSARATVAERPTDPRAVELYLRARVELRRYWGHHAQIAADLLAQAAAYAPTSPPIVGAHAFAAVHAWVMRGEDALRPIAAEALARGLALGHGEAFLASAVWKLNHGDVEDAGRDLGTALLRAPMFGQAHEITARILGEVGTMAEARHHFATAGGLDPGRAFLVNADLARLDALEGNFVAADARVTALMNDADPPVAEIGRMFHARLAGWRRQRDTLLETDLLFPRWLGPEAATVIELLRAALVAPTSDLPAWRNLASRTVNPNRALRPQLFAVQLLAEGAAFLRRDALAIDSIDQATRLGLIDIVWVDHCPLFEPLRGLPAFREVRDRVASRAERVRTAMRSGSRS